ncbi:MAG: hypothetical protein CVV25_02470 [Ignavibacteriae bacterium HGW-Ignavibacteriae-4]|jgi:uncharacterized membrane protein|nr:MAG: hypothetical protein CVV25_02470 [Ignavibacteriae bacterium HGW-Ignavibacteriae-4]
MTSIIQKIYTILKYVFVVVPIVAGLDKFTNILTDWSQYVNPILAQTIPMNTDSFMMIIGVIEIAAGLLVLLKTKLGALVVSIWLALIALSLIASFSFVDVAVRDLVMAISAYILYLLSGDEL